MTSIANLKQAYSQGDITREAYWAAMQPYHLALLEYPVLFSDGPLAAIHITATGLELELASGCRFGWDPNDHRVATTLLVNTGAYEPVETEIILACASAAKTVLDIGANIGWYSVQIAQILAAQGGQVVAFEPMPKTRALLQNNLTRNPFGHVVTVQPFGLSNTASTQTMYVPRFSGIAAASIQDLHPEEENEQIECAFRTLDGFAEEAGLTAVGFIKIDVEGAELLALQGGMALLERDRPVLFIELLRKWSARFGYHPNDVIALLAGLGYACDGVAGDVLVPITQVDEDTVPTNYLFLHPERHAALRQSVLGRWGAR